MKNETKENESTKIPPVIHKRSNANPQEEQPRRAKKGRVPPLKHKSEDILIEWGVGGCHVTNQ